MGAGLGTLNSVLDKISDQVFDLELEAGRIPPPPQVILDKMFEEEQAGVARKAGIMDMDYIGPLATSQKRLFKTQGINQSIDSLVPLVELQIKAQQPVTALDRLKVSETVEEIFDANGMPQSLMNSDQEVEDIQQARIEAAQAAQAAELAAGAADAVPKLQGKTEEDSPLAAIAEAV